MSKILTVNNCHECPFSYRPKDPNDWARIVPLNDQIYGLRIPEYPPKFFEDMGKIEKADTRLICKKFKLVVEEYINSIHPDCKFKDDVQ